MSDIEEAKRVLKIEAQSILDLVDRIDVRFERAVSLLYGCEGKVIVSGMGKSGQIGKKIASTMSSTGTPALFVSPAESLHGDLGVISSRDVVIAISYGGESNEMTPLLNYVNRKGIPLIAITGKANSSLAEVADVFLDGAVREEACPLGVAPTSSSTAALALGDALAMALLKRRGFDQQAFAEFHPGGSLGRRLLTRVKDLMHAEDGVPSVVSGTAMSEVLALMTSKEVRGVCAVVDDEGSLIGSVTDGDVRRQLQKETELLSASAEKIMSRNPKTIDQDEMAEKALFLMEQFRIQTLFVIDKLAENPSRPVGILHLQDLIKAGLR